MEEKLTEMREIPAAEVFRNQARRTGSILGWSLVLLNVLTLGLEPLLNWWIPFLEQYSGAGSALISYAMVIPLMNLVMKRAPEQRIEKKKMHAWEFFLLLILAHGLGTLFNLGGNILNESVAAMTGREVLDMNPVIGMLNGPDPLMIFYVCLAGPVIEEYIYRWKLINHLRPFGEKAAILYSALMFGLMHGNLAQFLYGTVIGIIMGYMMVKTGRMLYNCLLHIFINSVSMLLVSVFFLGEPLAAMVTFGSFLLMIVEMVAALVLLFVFCGRVRLLPGDWPEGVTYRDFASVLYLNSGTIVFTLLCLAMIFCFLFLV